MDETVKISQLPSNTAPALTATVPTYNPVTSDTEQVAFTDMVTLWFNNIPAGGSSPVTRFDEAFADFVASGGVWTGDSYGSTRNASMTAAIVYINGRRISISAVTARAFTASRDTYIDILDNQNGTGTLVYTEVTNNNASPALAANSIRIGIIVTAAGSIASAGSVNQGEQDKIVPIASSVSYAVTDSLGNIVCLRDPGRKTIGYKQLPSNFDAGTSSLTDVTGLAAPVLVPAGRKVRIRAEIDLYTGGTTRGVFAYIRESAVTLKAGFGVATTGLTSTVPVTVELSPSAGLHTYKISIECQGGANVSALGASFIKVELV